jgi:hypothetical protein
VNRSKEDEFSKWLLEQIKQFGLCDKEQIVNSGAYILNVSPVTTTRYLQKLTSALGEYKIIPINARGQGYVATKDFPSNLVKDMFEFEINVDQLSKLQKDIASRK